jgi:hypothetical protein
MEDTKISAEQAGEIAMTFLMEDLEIAPDDQEWFSVLTSRPIGETWHVVEIGVEGLPDKWVLQVFDTGVCDPCHTFSTPVKPSEADTGIDEFPEVIAHVIRAERVGK